MESGACFGFSRPGCFHVDPLSKRLSGPTRSGPGRIRQSARGPKARFISVGDAVAPDGGTEIVDCDGAVVMPGLVNGHTHLYSALAVGMPPPPRAPRNFHETLQLVWWRLDRAHDTASIRASGQIGALAALRCGTTTLIDHHASPGAVDGSLDDLEEGIRQVGCRGVLCYETTDRNHAGEARDGLAENERYIRACQNRSAGQFAGMVGAHASFTLAEDSLAGCVDLCRRHRAGLHIHAAEDPVDEQQTRQLYGCGLAERFERHGIWDLEGTILAHGTHFSDQDLGVLNQHRERVTLAHNPSSNMNNGVGYTRVADVTRPPLLGTDGMGADMWRESRVALLKSHDAGRSLPAARLLEMLGASARLASRALGVSVGRLQPGAAADLVVTHYRPATPLTRENLADHLIFAMGPEHVRHVMIDGRWCLREGQVVSCDEAAVTDSARGIAQALHERLARLPA